MDSVDEERRAIVEVEVVTEKLGGAALDYLLDHQGKPLSTVMVAEVERRLREANAYRHAL